MDSTKQSTQRSQGEKVPREQHVTKAAHKSAMIHGGVKRSHHCHPRTFALCKICCNQKSIDLLICKLPFQILL